MEVEDNMSFKISDYKGIKDLSAMRKAFQNKIDDEHQSLKE